VPVTTGQHLDTRFGEPTGLTVAASPPELLVAVLSVSVAAGACDEGDGVFAACHRYQQDWASRCGSWWARPTSWCWTCGRSERAEMSVAGVRLRA
jgi:hypothetical protein